MPKALLVILLFTLSFFVSAQNYTNCIEQQGLGKVEWSSDATSIYVRATIFGSSAGWGAVGFNKIGEKMVGASIYLGWKPAQQPAGVIYEYIATANDKPRVLSDGERQFTDYKAAVINDGKDIQLTFTRPLKGAGNAPSGYFEIKNENQAVLLARNANKPPTDSTNFEAHTDKATLQTNLLANPGNQCSLASTLKMSVTLLAFVIACFALL